MTTPKADGFPFPEDWSLDSAEGSLTDVKFVSSVLNSMYAADPAAPAVEGTGLSPGNMANIPNTANAANAAVPGMPPAAEAGLQMMVNEILAESTLPRSFDFGMAAPSHVASAADYYFLRPLPAPVRPLPLAADHFDVQAIRADFPILHQRVNGRPLIWLDNAATTQKPRCVIDAVREFYERDNSNIHRAAHTLAARSTDAYEAARAKVQRFLGAADPDEIIFVRGTTEGINLLAQTYGKQFVGAGDEIIVGMSEHHANIVPWQMLANEKGAQLRVIPIDERGDLILERYESLLSPRTRIVAVSQVSNALGTVNPVATIIESAHRHGAVVVVDGAQGLSHFPVNVQELDADFYVFSGHKLFAPTGIGAVYGKSALLAKMPPWQGGGHMIETVTFERTVYAEPPRKFEAGTGNIADAVGLGAAIDYLTTRVFMHRAAEYERRLTQYAMERLVTVPGLRPIGTSADKVGVLSFVLAGYPTLEVGKYLDEQGIAVRAGHHCAQPTMQRYGVDSTVRPSLAFYNTCEEIDALVAALQALARR